MIGVSEHLVTAVRAALQGDASGMRPIESMDNHFCSFEKDREDASQYKLIFPIEVDGRRVYIYLKISS